MTQRNLVDREHSWPLSSTDSPGTSKKFLGTGENVFWASTL